MTKKFDINNIDSLTGELNTANGLLDALSDILNKSLQPINDAQDYENLTDSQIAVIVYELYRDNNTLVSLINVLQEKILKAINVTENEASNYYLDHKGGDK